MLACRTFLAVTGLIACAATLPASGGELLKPGFQAQAWESPTSLVQPASYQSSNTLYVEDTADESVFTDADGQISPVSYTSGCCDSCGTCGGSCGNCGDVCCDSCCDPCASCCGGCGLFGGLIKPSERCFDMISPISNPLFFEDPRTLTEARLIYANHNIPGSQPLFQGGNVQYWALQLRAALSERVSIIATKDGYIDLRADNPAVPDNEGWADVAAGLKVNLIRSPQTQFLLSGGLVYEIDMGAHRVFQGRGDGEFHLFLSGYKKILGGVNFISGSGFRLPTDTAARSQMWYWSNHVDYEVFENIFALFEVNWFHWMRSGKALPGVNFEGGDLFNLGSGAVAGNDIVTAAVGGRVKFTEHAILGVGWEFPLTNRRDLLHDRLYADFILRY